MTPGYSGYKEGFHYLIQDFYIIFVQYAPYSVDSFFFLSGFLATFSIYRSIKKFGDRPFVYIPMSYLARFLRIAPMMMFATAIQWTLADQIPYGYHVLNRSSNGAVCKDSWYQILWFYANIGLSSEATDSDMSCMGHLWYIQCDMQMFLLLPILLWIFTKHKVGGLVASLLPTVICIVIRLYYGFYYEFTANMMVPAYATKHGGSLNNDSYMQPWTRMAVYFTAVSLAFLMVIIDETRNSKFVLRAWQYWSCMLMAAFIMLSLMLWPYQDVENAPDDRWGKTANSMYYALGRPAWVCNHSLTAYYLSVLMIYTLYKLVAVSPWSACCKFLKCFLAHNFEAFCRFS